MRDTATAPITGWDFQFPNAADQELPVARIEVAASNCRLTEMWFR